MKFGVQVGLGPGHIVLDEDPAPPPQRATTPQFSVHICCGQMAAWIKMYLGMELGLGAGDFVLDGDPDPLQKKGRSPQIFGPCLLWPNGWMDEAITCHGGRTQPRRLCVRWGPSPYPNFGLFYCGQTAECIKMPLGIDVGISPVDFVLYGDPVPPPQNSGRSPQIFDPCLLWANGWMDQDATWRKGRPQPMQLC